MFYLEKGEIMKLKVSDADLFKAVFQCITRFVDKVHFEVLENGIHIKSIDPHDFCFVDLTLLPAFFNSYCPLEEFRFGLDVSKLYKILPNLISAKNIFIEFNTGNVQFQTVGEWVTTFTLHWSEKDPYDLPEPTKFKYGAYIDLPTKQFSDLVKKASTISHEICFSIKGDTLILNASSGDYSFEAKSSIPLKINSTERSISVSTISNYLKLLEPLISKCEMVEISLGNDMPLRLHFSYLNKGYFSFFISHQKMKPERTKRTDRGGTSLPRVSVSRFPDFLVYLSRCPEGVENSFLVMAQLETKGSDYSRLANMLGFTIHEKGKIMLTPEGKEFVSNYENKMDLAKQQIHIISLQKIFAYKIMMENLISRPMSVDEVHEYVNATLKERGKPEIDQQDISTLLGLATWCGSVDRRLSLYYFSVGEKT